jgi:hypothetical protein
VADGYAPREVVAGRAVGVSGEQQPLDDAAEVVEGFQRGGELGAIGEAGGLQPGEMSRQRGRGDVRGSAARVEHERLCDGEVGGQLARAGLDPPGSGERGQDQGVGQPDVGVGGQRAGLWVCDRVLGR